MNGAAGAPAATTLDAGKRRVAAAVAAHRDEILALSHAIHADPEPAFQEVHAATRVADALRGHGFTVEAPAGRLATAVRATLAGGLGTDGPRVGILAEYDALPGLGHGCGHNTMAASGVGAALALADLASGLRGEIVFLGTPAEEAGSGKQYMLDDGLFEGLDAALLFHPGDRDHAACALLACEDVEVTFTGLQAHAASDPWSGRNALDAMILLFTSIGLWRQQLRRMPASTASSPTGAPPPTSSPTGRWPLHDPQHRTRRSSSRCASGSARWSRRPALATGTEAATVFSSGSTVMKDNATLAARFRANMLAAGRADQGVDPERLGSSDMGNVSLVLPTIHPTLAICDDGVPGHSTLFRDAAATPRADETTLLAATLVAQTAYELFTEPGLVEAAWREFRGA